MCSEYTAKQYLDWYFTKDEGIADKDAVSAYFELLREYNTVEHALKVLKSHGWKEVNEYEA